MFRPSWLRTVVHCRSFVSYMLRVVSKSLIINQFLLRLVLLPVVGFEVGESLFKIATYKVRTRTQSV